VCCEAAWCNQERGRQKAIAEAADISKQAVSNRFAGRQEPTAEQVLAETPSQELPAPNLFAPILPVEYYRKTSHRNKARRTSPKLVLGRKKKNKPADYDE